MAEPSLHHNTTSTQNLDALADSNGTGPLQSISFPFASVDEASGPSFANAVPQENSGLAHSGLPLRQAPRRGASPPQIHDVTEKFTRACKGKCWVMHEVPILGIDACHKAATLCPW